MTLMEGKTHLKKLSLLFAKRAELDTRLTKFIYLFAISRSKVLKNEVPVSCCVHTSTIKVRFVRCVKKFCLLLALACLSWQWASMGEWGNRVPHSSLTYQSVFRDIFRVSAALLCVS